MGPFGKCRVCARKRLYSARLDTTPRPQWTSLRISFADQPRTATAFDNGANKRGHLIVHVWSGAGRPASLE